ncbi:MAG TPA: toll/interleukin-1 receptor domain-containing protein [Anaerolineales bacterium]|nr:toll/interleukin-1 receptor domain-containing protein [Anaerolineales bacterium]HNA88794.1 toll/interleukin-1 receptor domain-containing protein [Anaerolineales bacterium]HNB35436.1 toll/interleukin-1 receptor domain-containing protein [Anaerolineales bacterium]HNC07190.1 toll/interleukin-1 receptor domain-containing protein [Anaerolineales bacterium]
MPHESTAGTSNKRGEESSRKKLIPFLSYSKLNQTSARDFAEKLKSEGWIDPWFDEEDILPGQVWEELVTTGVRNSHAVIIMLSKVAVASEGFFQKEIKLALDTAAEKPDGTIFIIPIRLNDCEVPQILKKYQYVDYFGREEQKERDYNSLIAALKVRAENLGIKTQP